MIPRLQTEQELEDPYAADEEYLREVIAQVSAPVQTTGVPGGGVDTSQFSEAAQTGLTQGGLKGVRPSYTKFSELGDDFQTYTPVGTTGDAWSGKTTTYDVYDPYGTATGQQAVVQSGGLQEGLETFLIQAAPLMVGTPLAPFAQAYSAVKAIEAGNIAGGIASLAGLGGYTDIANAARLVGAAKDKDPLAFLSAGMNLTGTKDIGGFTTKDITAANAVVQGLQTGNVAQALNGAAQLTDSPNVALAGAAVGMLDAAKSGNPAAMLKAGEALSGAINNAQNQAAITQAYQDPSRQLDTVTGTDLRDAGLTTAVGSEDLTTQDLVDIVNPPGQVAATPTTTAAPTSTTTTTPAERLAGEYIDKLGVKDALTNEQVAQFQIAYQQATSKLGDRPVDQLSIQDILNNAPNIIGKDEAGRWLDDQGYSYDAQGNKYRADTNIPVIEIAAGLGEQQEPSKPVDLSNVQNSANALQEWANGLQGTEGEVIRQALSTGAGLFGEQIADLGFALSNMGFADRTNFLVRFGQILEQTGQNLEIPQVTEATKNFWKALEAPGSYAEKASAGFKAIIQNPLVLTQVVKEVGQEALPLLVGGGLGKLLGWAGQGIARAGTMGGDLLLNSAESMGSTARSKFQEELDKGTPEAEAARLANADGWKAFAITATLAGVSDAGLVKKIEGGLDKLFGKVASATGKEWGEEGLEELAISLATGDSLETAIAKSLAGSFIGSKTSGSLQAQSEFNQKVADVTQQVADALRSEGITSTDGSFRPSTFTDVASQASVGTDAETGQDVSLGDLTGPSIRDAGITTAVDPTEALSGTELDSQQIISDYVNEVLGANAPATTDAAANVVVGTDQATGADVTLADLGLSGSATGPTADAASELKLTGPDVGPKLNSGTVLSTDPSAGTALVVDGAGNANVVNVSSDTKTGDQINLGNVDTSVGPQPGSGAVNLGTVDTSVGPQLGSGAVNLGNVEASTGPQLVAGEVNLGNVDTSVGPQLGSGNLNLGNVDASVGPQLNTGKVLAVDSASGTALVTDSKGNTSVVNTGGDTKAGDTVNLGGTTIAGDTALATDSQGNTLTAADVGAASTANTAADTNAAVTAATAPVTNAATDATTSTATDAATAPVTDATTTASTTAATDATTNQNTGVETATATNPNTGTTTTTQTDANTNTSVTTDTNPNTNTTTSTATDANTNTSTTTATDANTNTTTQTDTNPNTGVTTQTESNPNTNTSTTTTTDANTGVTTQTDTNNNTNTTTQTEANPNTNTTTTTETNTNTGVETNTQTDTNTGVTTQTETNPNTNTTTTTETNPNTNTTTTTETNTNTNTTVTTETNTNTGVSTTTTVDTTTGKVINTNVDEPLPPGEDVLPPVTEEELREIVSGPPPAPTPPAPTPAPPAPTPAPPAPTPAPPAPTPAPPAPTPAPPAPTPAPPAPTVKPPVLKPPSPAPSPAAQLAKALGIPEETVQQVLMQTDPADLLKFTMALQAEREEKREGLRGKLKSRKA